MNRAFSLVLLIGFAPANAQACSANAMTLFSCTFGGGAKTAEDCLGASDITYRFGPTGETPELIVEATPVGVHLTPWNGIGRAIWEEVVITNAGYDYLVHYSAERDPGGAVSGGIVVAQGGSEVAQLTCDEGTVAGADFYPLYDAKEAAGQCYDRANFVWGPC